ncbi:hypothetical protein F5Y16DRAFT_222492 [Xylariaceae sp. FL0255]|nr:hypothetical protein F5Y16DRAFT_222492 [Xylariaceae sp. FL0255]
MMTRSLAFTLLPLAGSATTMGSLPARTADGGFLHRKAPLPTPAPRYVPENLYERASTLGQDTCGYGYATGDEEWLTYECYQTIGSCVNMGNYRGCCTGGLAACSSTFVTSCSNYDYKSTISPPPGIVSCGSDAPWCRTWYYTESALRYTAYDCDIQNVYSTVSMGTVGSGGVTFTETSDTPTSATDFTDSSTTSTTGDSTSSPTGSPTTTLANSTATDQPDSSSNKSNSSSSIAGPVAGGVVGGLAVIAILVLGLIYLRKHYGNNTPKEKTRPVSPPAPTMGPSEVQGSDASQISHGPGSHQAGYVYPGQGQGQSYYSPVAQSETPDTAKYPYSTPSPQPPAYQTTHNQAYGTYNDVHEAPNNVMLGSHDNRAELN